MEGQIEMLGEFAAAVNRSEGWRRGGGRTFVIVFLLVPTILGACFFFVALVLTGLRAVFG